MDVSAREQNERPREAVFWVRNLLVVFGVYWLSLWLATLLGLSVGITHVTAYSENMLSAFYMGAATSWERTLAAILAGIVVTRIVPGRGSQYWAFLLAVLYAIDYRMRSHWALPPTAWDRLSMRVERFLPAVACVLAALVTAWLRTRAERATVRAGG
jgi:hypothetical protein